MFLLKSEAHNLLLLEIEPIHIWLSRQFEHTEIQEKIVKTLQPKPIFLVNVNQNYRHRENKKWKWAKFSGYRHYCDQNIRFSVGKTCFKNKVLLWTETLVGRCDHDPLIRSSSLTSLIYPPGVAPPLKVT